VSRRLATAGALVLALASAAVMPATAGATAPVRRTEAPNVLPPPNPVSPEIFLPASQTKPPPGFAVNALQAVRIAEGTRAVRAARARHPDLKGEAYISPLRLASGTFYHWEVIFSSHGHWLAEVDISAAGKVLEIQTAPDVGWNLLRGYPGVLGGKLNAPYVWLPLCLLFLLPFIDPRRPFRALHLDLLMLLAFGISHYFFAAGRPDISVPLAYPFLAYVVGRMLFAALRPAHRTGPLMPHVGTGLLAAVLVLLLAFRIGLGLADSKTFDISTAGVVGADRIEHGLPLYVYNDSYGDTYGPLNYLMYVPFELAFPYTPAKGASDAARPATLAFDLLTVVGLFLLGRRLRPGARGTRMGVALAYGWTAYPYTALVIASNTNDALVPLFVVYALVLINSPPGRGLLTGLGSLTKFAPMLIAPVIAVGRGPFRLRPALVATAAFALTWVVLVGVFLPDGGVSEFWKTTLGFQLQRTSPLSIWVRDPGLHWLRPIVEGLVILLAVGAAFVPSRRTVGQIAALCAAILAAAQIPANYWIYFYLVWFAPFVLIALFEEFRDLGPRRESAPSGSP
jgi:hypothetical protein